MFKRSTSETNSLGEIPAPIHDGIASLTINAGALTWHWPTLLTLAGSLSASTLVQEALRAAPVEASSSIRLVCNGTALLVAILPSMPSEAGLSAIGGTVSQEHCCLYLWSSANLRS